MSPPSQTQTQVATRDKGEFTFTPMGEQSPISFSLAIVRNQFCKPTKSGVHPSDQDVIAFAVLCRSQLLNPYLGDCWMTGYDSKDGPQFSILTSQRVLLKRAEIHPQFDGIESGITVEAPDGTLVDLQSEIRPKKLEVVGAWARVYRKDRTRPTYKQIGFGGMVKDTHFWKNNPEGMLVKCFDEETEVLTTRGFEKFAIAEGAILEVTEGALRPTESVPFFQPYTGDMIEWTSRNGNFRVTPNHDMPLAINGEPETKIEARHMLEMRCRDEMLMPLTAKFCGHDFQISDKSIQIAAAYIADGSDNSKSSGFCISVSKERKVSALRNIGMHISESGSKAAGNEAHCGSGRVIRTLFDKRAFYYSRTEEIDWIVQRGKVINTDAILRFSQRQAKLFVDTWMGFDGSKPASCLVGRIYMSRPLHCAAMELAATVAGYSISQRSSRQSDIGGPGYCMTLTNRPAINILKNQLVVSQNKRGVWCVKVPSGKIVVRRHGFSAICHQCAESDALRFAFPTTNGGLYTHEEATLDIGGVLSSVRVEETPKQIASEPGQLRVVDAQPEPKTVAAASLHAELEAKLASSEINPGEFIAYLAREKQLANADSLGDLSEIPAAEIPRLLRGWPARVEAIAKVRA